MPTNLKSLLSRSRSRNELKLREKGEESGSPELSNEAGGGSGNSSNASGQCRCDVTNTNSTSPDHGGLGMRRDASCKSFFSCSALHGVGLAAGDATTDSTTTTTCLCQNASGSGSIGSSGTCSCIHIPTNNESCQTLSIRKCETVLALSTFTGNSSDPHSSTTSSSSPNSSFTAMATCSPTTPRATHAPSSPLEAQLGSSSSSTSSGRVKVMKDKIFSTSSSTLNSLIHSSNRTTSKFLGGWKFPSSTSHSGNSGSSSYSTATSTHEISPGNHGVNTTLLLSVGAPSPVADSLHNPFSSTNLLQGVVMSGKKSKSQLSISETGSGTPLTPVNRLRRNVSVNNSYCCFSNNPALCGPYSRSSSVTSFTWKEDQGDIFCRLCLSHCKLSDTVQVEACSCRYCKDCLLAYMNFEIQEGAYEIACPDASCDKEGVLTLAEIETLVSKPLMDKHKKFRLYREVEKDAQVMWCPSPGCETVCFVEDVGEKSRPGCSTTSITCTTCSKTFCAECKLSWHPDTSCESFRRKLVKQGKLSVDDEELYSIESIKKCPFCHVPIEKDSGCAQMMCKRCKHVFCWYCLSSLDDDFLLRHYDKGPCKNKLGHSRASVVWHRAQVIGIFAGFGVLVLLASPLLILAAPCLLCCRCRYCANKLDPDDPISL